MYLQEVETGESDIVFKALYTLKLKYCLEHHISSLIQATKVVEGSSEASYWAEDSEMDTKSAIMDLDPLTSRKGPKWKMMSIIQILHRITFPMVYTIWPY